MGNENTSQQAPQQDDALRQELVEHFREKRDVPRQQWVQQMTAKGLLAGLTQEEIETESMTTQKATDNIMARCFKGTDDALVLVVRYKGCDRWMAYPLT